MSENWNTIVVGVDGSHHGFRALEWAAGEAAARGNGVLLLHALALDSPEIWGAGGRIFADRVKELRQTATDLLAQASERLRALAPGVRVGTHVAPESPVRALLDAAAHADLIVVGTRGQSLAQRMVSGSVSRHVATHSPIPVVVVPEQAVEGSVVVGVDGSLAASTALHFAVDEARHRRSPLVVVNAWHESMMPGFGLIPPDERDYRVLAGLADELLQRQTAPYRTMYPELRITARAAHGDPTQVLLAESNGCGLLVLGSHSHNPVSRVLLGSLALTAVSNATCPVAVVPCRRRHEQSVVPEARRPLAHIPDKIAPR